MAETATVPGARPGHPPGGRPPVPPDVREGGPDGEDRHDFGSPQADERDLRRGPGQGVVLIGPPTAGKSSVGKLLAKALDVPFADTDALVAEAARKPVSDIFVDDGETVFRELERGAVARGLNAVKADGGVLALGSGAVLDPDVRRMIEDHLIVYLEAEFATVAKRVGMDRPRVVIPGNPRGRLRSMLEDRRPVYSHLAHLTVPTDNLAAEEVAADLAKRLRA